MAPFDCASYNLRTKSFGASFHMSQGGAPALASCATGQRLGGEKGPRKGKGEIRRPFSFPSVLMGDQVSFSFNDERATTAVLLHGHISRQITSSPFSPNDLAPRATAHAACAGGARGRGKCSPETRCTNSPDEGLSSTSEFLPPTGASPCCALELAAYKAGMNYSIPGTQLQCLTVRFRHEMHGPIPENAHTVWSCGRPPRFWLSLFCPTALDSVHEASEWGAARGGGRGAMKCHRGADDRRAVNGVASSAKAHCALSRTRSNGTLQ